LQDREPSIVRLSVLSHGDVDVILNQNQGSW
jgi:hypothetical protein